MTVHDRDTVAIFYASSSRCNELDVTSTVMTTVTTISQHTHARPTRCDLGLVESNLLARHARQVPSHDRELLVTLFERIDQL